MARQLGSLLLFTPRLSIRIKSTRIIRMVSWLIYYGFCFIEGLLSLIVLSLGAYRRQLLGHDHVRDLVEERNSKTPLDILDE